jgi:hypothetical protein
MGIPVRVSLANGHIQAAAHLLRSNFQIDEFKDTGNFLATELEGEDVILGIP